MKFNKWDTLISIALILVCFVSLSFVFIDSLFFKFAYNFNNISNPIAILKNVNGDIRIKPPDLYQWIPAQANMKLGAGFQIYSGEKSSVNIEAESWDATVEEKSYLYIDSLDNLNRLSVDSGNISFKSKSNDVVLKVCDESLEFNGDEGENSLTAESDCIKKPKINVSKGKIRENNKINIVTNVRPDSNEGVEKNILSEEEKQKRLAADLESLKQDILKKKKPELIKPKSNDKIEFTIDSEGIFLGPNIFEMTYSVNNKIYKKKLDAKMFLEQSLIKDSDGIIEYTFEKQTNESWSVVLSNQSIENFIDLSSEKVNFTIKFNIQKSIDPVKIINSNVFLDVNNYLNSYAEWDKNLDHSKFKVQLSKNKEFSNIYQELQTNENRYQLKPIHKTYYVRIKAIGNEGQVSPLSEVVTVNTDLGEIELKSKKEYIIKNNEKMVQLEFKPLVDIKQYGVQISNSNNFESDTILKFKSNRSVIDFKYPQEGNYFWRVWPVNQEGTSLSSLVKSETFRIIKVRKIDPPKLLSPEDKSTQYFQGGKEIFSHLKWEKSKENDDYEIQLATDAQFENIINIFDSKVNNKVIYFDKFYNKVFWRVRSRGKAIETSEWSEARSIFFYKD